MLKTLVLSGGGVNGFVHIGALQALQTLKMLNHISMVVGTSVGALIGTLYCIGLTADQIYEIFVHIDSSILHFSSLDRLVTEMGLDTGKCLMNVLVNAFLTADVSPNLTFQQLWQLKQRHLVINATNLSQGRCCYFEKAHFPDMQILQAVRLSISIPFIFTANLYQGDFYVDGAVMANYPIDYALHHTSTASDKQHSVLGINLSFQLPRLYAMNLYNFTLRVFECMTAGRQDVSGEGRKCTVPLQIAEPISGINFDIGLSSRLLLVKEGIRATKKHIESYTEKSGDPVTKKSTVLPIGIGKSRRHSC